ncbi:MAG: hypothetical protein WCQ57_02180 [Verrucomicrobiota bacterium]
MKSPRFQGDSRDGAALLLTLWCIAVVAVTVVLTARIVGSDVEDESMRSRRFEARELALNGIAHGMNPGLKRGSEILHQKREDGGGLAVRVTSESARLNINRLVKEKDAHTLKNLFALWGVPADEARVAVDSLADWVDEGDLRRLNGAEREDLQNQTTYALPQNRDFQSLSEVRRVRGMDAVARHQADWGDYFSVFSRVPLDIQDALPEVLRVWAGLSGEQAESLVEFRNGGDGLPGTFDDRVIQSLDEVIRRTGLSEAQAEALRAGFQVGAEPTRIESTGRVGGMSFRICTVADRSQQKPARLNWEEQ